MKGVDEVETILTSGIQEMKAEKTLTDIEMQRLIDSYGNDILRLCALYLKDRHLAEDALQETYIKVWQKYSTYRGQADEKTWITRIAINVCKNILRTSWFKRTETTEIIEIIKGSRDYYKQVDESVDVMHAIQGMKEKYRSVLLLYYYQEFSIKEISEILGMKQSTVLSLLRRGRYQLRQALKVDYMEGDIYEV